MVPGKHPRYDEPEREANSSLKRLLRYREGALVAYDPFISTVPADVTSFSLQTYLTSSQ